MKLVHWYSWPQVDGGLRHALDTPRDARRKLAEVRRDRAMAECLGAEVLVDEDRDGRLRAWEWPGRSDGLRPPWPQIRDALRCRDDD